MSYLVRPIDPALRDAMREQMRRSSELSRQMIEAQHRWTEPVREARRKHDRLALVFAEHFRKEHPDWTWARISREADRAARRVR